MKYTERHCGVAVIKDKSRHKEDMEKLAKIEEEEEILPQFVRCKDCRYFEKHKRTKTIWCKNMQGLTYNLTENDGCTRGEKKDERSKQHSTGRSK